MRGIAAVRSRAAQARLGGVRSYAATVGTSIAQALALLPGTPVPSDAASGAELEAEQMLIVLCAEQGFVGGFNTRLIQAAAAALPTGGACEVLLVGDRGAMAASERGLSVHAVLPMVAHIEAVPTLADRLIMRLFERAQRGQSLHVTLIHGVPTAAPPCEIAQKRLLPFDYARFPQVNNNQPPLLTLPAAQLLEQLTQEYLFAELCEALLLSHAAENAERMRAMVAAHENVERMQGELTRLGRQLRQEAITNEVIELAAGERS
jgi:F-type H+-transporting ATPase subunit gamma